MSTSVWLVRCINVRYSSQSFDNDVWIGIFSTREKAQDGLDRVVKTWGEYGYSYALEEFKLDPVDLVNF